MEERWYTQYLYAFYFAIVTMCTVGYGDVVPVTPREKILVIIIIFISCGTFGYSLNCINGIIDDFNKQNH